MVAVETAQSDSRVSGILPGFPCTVDLTALENVSDYSFTERPEARNDWRRVAVKVRPKNNDRPVHFIISWVSLPPKGGPTGKSPEALSLRTSSQFEPVTVLKRVSPTYPTVARTTLASGMVVVMVDIDENGKVVAAKATEGPAVLRQSAESAAKQWEFKPAKLNGVAVRASQRLVFNFQR